ncbi:MAG TPA: extracellular solute-binding protein, partial [Spirochaetia bacterium]|nr:extracellular solute-binding protein [Spirochaetia bacterium]
MKRLSIFVSLFAIVAFGAFASGSGEQGSAKAAPITMWMQNYGNDLNTQQKAMADLAGKFEAETGIKVNVEVGNWSEASKKWLLVATGGDHPDVGDMWWAWSNVQIGKGKFGPMPLDQYKDQLHLDNFYPAALADVTYDGHIYGIPWRIDV